jgi:hypothetical protein
VRFGSSVCVCVRKAHLSLSVLSVRLSARERTEMPLFLNGDFPNWHSVQRRPTTPEHQAYLFEQAKQYAAAVRNGGGVTGRPPSTLEAIEALRAVQGNTIILRNSSSSAFLQRQREGLPRQASLALRPSSSSAAPVDGHKHLHRLEKLGRTDSGDKPIRRSKRTSRLKERHQALLELEQQVGLQLSRSKLERSSDSLLDDTRTKQLLKECAEETSTTRKLILSKKSTSPPPPPPPPAPPAPPSPKRTLRVPPQFDHNRFYNASTNASDGHKVFFRPVHQHEINAAREGQRRAERATAASPTGPGGRSSPVLRQTASLRRPQSASMAAFEMPVVSRPSSASSCKPKPPLSYSLSYGSLGVWAAFRHAQDAD